MTEPDQSTETVTTHEEVHEAADGSTTHTLDTSEADERVVTDQD